MKVCVIFILLFVSVIGDGLYEEFIFKDAMKIVKECGSKTLSLCLKEKALKFIERLPNNIDIGNGIRIRQNESERSPRKFSPVALPEDKEKREAVLDRVLVERIVDYLSSHTLELKIPMLLENEELVEEARKEGGGGGYGGGYGGGDFGGGGGGGKKNKGGKKGGMSGMMMMMMFKSATLYAIGLKAVGAIAFKALLVAKVALTIAIVIALKKIVESGKGQTQTYEVIAHSPDDHGHNDRLFNPAELVYRGHRVGAR